MEESTLKNAFTIDVEDWYQTMDFNHDSGTWDGFEDRIEPVIDKILEVLSEHNVKATFFVLGFVAKMNPKLIRKLVDIGHEVGSHGLEHKMVTTQTPDEFLRDIKEAKKIIEDATGKEVNAYRSSTWSICRETKWALELLEEEGYKYDSSMQPFKTPISGCDNIPTSPFYPIVDGAKLNLLEIPPTVLKVKAFMLPFSGGLFLRVLPYLIIRYALENVNKKQRGMIYTHPWELDVNQPRINVPIHVKLAHYYNIGTTYDKIKLLLRDFEFGTISEVFGSGSYDSFRL